MANRLFSAQLRYWRGRLGLSQLDVALMAEVSARHISFLESGRAQPSEAMVLRLMAALKVPVREQNAVLQDAGFAPRYPEPDIGRLDPSIQFAIERMLEKHEPYPMTVLDAGYDIVFSNNAAKALLARFVANPSALAAPMNVFCLVFDPGMARPFIKNWEQVAQGMLARLHHEMLEQGENPRLKTLFERMVAYPDVPAHWRQPDFSQPSAPTLAVALERDDMRLRFFTTTTVFTAPRQVTLAEIRLESYFPMDEETRSGCESLAASGYNSIRPNDFLPISA